MWIGVKILQKKRKWEKKVLVTCNNLAIVWLGVPHSTFPCFLFVKLCGRKEAFGHAR